jgi:hypothetical protein
MLGKSTFSVLICLILLTPFSAFSEITQKYKDLSERLGYSGYETRKDLSPEEALALHNYKIGTGYNCIQSFLFESTRDKNGCFFLDQYDKPHRVQSDAVKAVIEKIDATLMRSKPIPGGLYLFRGQRQSYDIGSVFTRKGYTSTSASIDEARKFYSGSLLVIRVPKKGFPGMLMGEWEEEVLLPRNTTFMVIDIKQVNNENRILVEPCLDRCVPTGPTKGWENY